MTNGDEVTLHGVVMSGVGAAARFTELPWARGQFETKLGFRPFPGTFNIRLQPSDEAAWSQLRARPGIEITPEPGACLSFCYPLLVNGRISGAALRPEVAGYPQDIVEILAAIHLRSALGLVDGNAVELCFTTSLDSDGSSLPALTPSTSSGHALRRQAGGNQTERSSAGRESTSG